MQPEWQVLTTDEDVYLYMFVSPDELVQLSSQGLFIGSTKGKWCWLGGWTFEFI